VAIPLIVTKVGEATMPITVSKTNPLAFKGAKYATAKCARQTNSMAAPRAASMDVTRDGL
jgi:hypothetical protein